MRSVSKTSVGKAFLLKNMIVHDTENGNGSATFDL